jgi:hypothetical protein
MTTVTVITLQRGHDGAQVREIGEEFELPADSECLVDGSTWLRPVDPKAAEQYAKRTLTEAPRIAAQRASVAEKTIKESK